MRTRPGGGGREAAGALQPGTAQRRRPAPPEASAERRARTSPPFPRGLPRLCGGYLGTGGRPQDSTARSRRPPSNEGAPRAGGDRRGGGGWGALCQGNGEEDTAPSLTDIDAATRAPLGGGGGALPPSNASLGGGGLFKDHERRSCGPPAQPQHAPAPYLPCEPHLVGRRVWGARARGRPAHAQPLSP